ncbi:SnoaL-like domain-containing protein [Erythrobacter litoralis]|uniref:nuclear transport factor 2 family protein n=1 Tax=Erythrobacter TaxID=1041 RepID=UPI000863B837|nr:nuclear transport factor 2 family protein [Erythrobacter litoralis]AOL22130.1 SnoaL-like domain-containing protein [Erythrobacter litoralis]MEE4338185.1 nuclear transport factor 2 family protein [Erythrobacter sp.]
MSASTGPGARLEALIAKQEIAEVMQRYSRTLDWLDDEGQASCYWPDAPVDYGFFSGTAADFVPVVMEIERASQRRWHMLSGIAIRLHSPTRASAECYGMATGIRQQEDGSWQGNLYGGRYLDEFEKRPPPSDPDGEMEWRISKRQYVMDWRVPLTDQPGSDPDPNLPLPILQIVDSGHDLYRRM